MGPMTCVSRNLQNICRGTLSVLAGTAYNIQETVRYAWLNAW